MSVDVNLIAGLRSLVDRLEERMGEKDAEIEYLLLELKYKRDIERSAQHCLSCGLLAPHHQPWCGSPQMEIERLTRERDELLRLLEFAKPYVHDAMTETCNEMEAGGGLTLEEFFKMAQSSLSQEGGGA